ncbi:MAG: AAA family ATPase [Lactobacillus sp.]|jgi:AAA15 family ATPase/GTPase|nr:AAA family ATPase [Lactobacillus sp.]
MFTSIEFGNYQSFERLFLDMQQKGQPKPLIAIYGENGAGKSNIVSAFMNLALSLRTYQNQLDLGQVDRQAPGIMTLREDDQLAGSLRQNGDYQRTDTILDVFENCYMLAATAPLRLSYQFVIDGHKGSYELIFKKDHGAVYLAAETLKYLINTTTGILFNITKATAVSAPVFKFSPRLFQNSNVTRTFKDSVQRLWGKHTLLALFYTFSKESNATYISDNIAKNFLTVFNEMLQLSFKTDQGISQPTFQKLLSGNLYNGLLLHNAQEQAKLANTELALNKYFIPLYSDILSLKYRTESINNTQLRYVLYESKRIEGKVIDIPFVLESHGTKQLLALFPLLLSAQAGGTVVIDELDAGIHDLLINRIVENISEDLQGQLIFTTHDTQLMREIAPSSLYVIRSDADGRKRVEPLPSIAKIKANNNVQKLYLEGYFDGIPYTEDVDFDDILNEINEARLF